MRKSTIKVFSLLTELVLALSVLCAGYMAYRVYQNSLHLSPDDCTDASTVFQYLIYGK